MMTDALWIVIFVLSVFYDLYPGINLHILFILFISAIIMFPGQDPN